jgi:hypothetical protein
MNQSESSEMHCFFDYSMLSSMNNMIRENSVCVCLSNNWWQSVSANNLDVNSFEWMKCISLININVHACAQMSFFSLLVEMSVIWMIDKHIVTAVSLRFRFQTRHAPFFMRSLSMRSKLNISWKNNVVVMSFFKIESCKEYIIWLSNR